MTVAAKVSYPAHCPYEDGWGFCPKCQRFYKATHCPEHMTIKLLQESTRKRPKGGWKRNRLCREVSDQGLGLPRWAQFTEYSSTPDGIKTLQNFRTVQSEIIDKIMVSTGIVTFKELGAKRFQNHWFERLENEGTAVP